MTSKELSANETELVVDTDVNILGKIGEFGQPIIRKKADTMLKEFVENIKKQLTGKWLGGRPERHIRKEERELFPIFEDQSQGLEATAVEAELKKILGPAVVLTSSGLLRTALFHDF